MGTQGLNEIGVYKIVRCRKYSFMTDLIKNSQVTKNNLDKSDSMKGCLFPRMLLSLSPLSWEDKLQNERHFYRFNLIRDFGSIQRIAPSQSTTPMSSK